MIDTSNLAFWSVTISAPTQDSVNNNLADASVTFSFNDGAGHAYQVTDSLKGVQGMDDLLKLIQTNFVAHQNFVNTLLNTPVGNIDLTKLFPAQAQQPSLVLA